MADPGVDMSSWWRGYMTTSDPQFCWLTAEGREVWISPDPATRGGALTWDLLKQAMDKMDTQWQRNLAYQRGQQYITGV